MRITRKVFSIYSEDKLISAIEERAFNEGYQAAQREFAEEEDDEKEEKSRARKRNIGKVLTGAGVVGGAVGAGKTLVDIDKNEISFKKQINDLVDNDKKYYDKRIGEAYSAAQDLKNEANSKYSKAIGNIEFKNFDDLEKGWSNMNELEKQHYNTIKEIDSNLKKEVEGIREKFGDKVTEGKVEKLKGEAALNKGKIIKSNALKYGLPALAVTGIGAGMIYKNRKKKDKK